VKASAGYKLYVAECGTCHMAFPTSMLPARSWTALLAGLADHFKENAEVDLATRKALAAFLGANAGRDVAGPTPLRITTLPSWRREHDEVSAAVYARKAILTPANCVACHPGANAGAFGEHQVSIPNDAAAPRR
jgi:mono/diheme cytochrome c family protein